MFEMASNRDGWRRMETDEATMNRLRHEYATTQEEEEVVSRCLPHQWYLYCDTCRIRTQSLCCMLHHGTTANH